MACLGPRALRPLAVLLLAGAALLVACDFSSTKEPKDAGIHGEAPPGVSAMLELDARGGVVAILDGPSPLLGASLRVPPDALTRVVPFELAPAEALPEGSNAIGVGDALVIGPEDVTFRRPAIGEIPVPDGIALQGLAAARWDAEAASWELLPADTRYDDPRTERGGVVVFETTQTGTFRIVYQDPQPVEVLNDGSGALAVTIATQRFTTGMGRGYVPPPPERDELAQMVEPLTARTLMLVPGQYVLRGTFEGETEARCVALTVSDPVSSTDPLEVGFSDFTPPCPLPAVSVTASSSEVTTNEEVTLEAVATGGSGATFTWHWTATGGEITGETTGTVMTGATTEGTWVAPEVPGTYWVSFAAYADDEFFGTARARIEVATRNQRPRISTFAVNPDVVGPGFPSGARGNAETSFPGVARVRAVTSDLDGDEVDVFWLHGEPGNFFDAASGAKLNRDEDTGLVVWPEDGAPYTESDIFYMAPPADVLDTLTNGMWFPFGVVASDGQLRDRSWVMVSVVEDAPTPLPDAGPTPDGGRLDAGPPRDAGPRDAGTDAGSAPAVVGRCLSVTESECEMYVGSFYVSEEASLQSSCEGMSRAWTSAFACPESGALGACYRFPDEEREVATVYYDPSPTPGEIEMRRTACEALPVAEGGPGTWMSPYRAPR